MWRRAVLLLATVCVCGCSRPATPPEGFVCPPDTKFVKGGALAGGFGLKCVTSDGTMHGPARLLYESGAIEAEGEFRHGKRHGSWRTYRHDGEIVSETIYLDGAQQQGTSYVEGKKYSETTYRNERAIGMRRWFPNGTLAEEGSYSERKQPDGTWRRWTEDGQLMEEVDWDDGKVVKARRDLAGGDDDGGPSGNSVEVGDP